MSLLNTPPAAPKTEQICNAGGGGSTWHTAGCVIGALTVAVLGIGWLITKFRRPRPGPGPILPISSTVPATAASSPSQLALAESPPPAYGYAPPAPYYSPYARPAPYLRPAPYAPYPYARPAPYAAYDAPPPAPYPYYPYVHNTYIVDSGSSGDGIGAAIAANAAGAACIIM